MSRPVSSATDAAIAQTLTRPLTLVELGFSPPVRLSSREQVVWNSQLWKAASMSVTVSDRGGSVDIFNEELLFGQVVLAQGTAGRIARVWQLYGDGPDWTVDDAECQLDGEMGEAEIALRVRIALKHRPPQRTPRLLFQPPTFNHLPPAGLVIKTAAGTETLQAKPSPFSKTRRA